MRTWFVPFAPPGWIVSNQPASYTYDDRDRIEREQAEQDTTMSDLHPCLLPCPFCGKTPQGVNFQRKYDFDFAIECECGACMSQCEYGGGPGQATEEKTITQWNTRASDSQAEKLAGLLKEIKSLMHVSVRTDAATVHFIQSHVDRIDAALVAYKEYNNGR